MGTCFWKNVVGATQVCISAEPPPPAEIMYQYSNRGNLPGAMITIKPEHYGVGGAPDDRIGGIYCHCSAFYDGDLFMVVDTAYSGFAAAHGGHALSDYSVATIFARNVRLVEINTSTGEEANSYDLDDFEMEVTSYLGDSDSMFHNVGSLTMPEFDPQNGSDWRLYFDIDLGAGGFGAPSAYHSDCYVLIPPIPPNINMTIFDGVTLSTAVPVRWVAQVDAFGGDTELCIEVEFYFEDERYTEGAGDINEKQQTYPTYTDLTKTITVNENGTVVTRDFFFNYSPS